MFTRLMNRIFMPNLFKMDDEYCERFYKPLKERADTLGIPDGEFDVMWKFAWQAADPIVVGLAPGSIMRNLIDHWEADRISCMQFIADESRALGYKYTPATLAPSAPATGRGDTEG